MSGSAANLPGGNFMADMMAQNILSQHMTQIMNQAVTGFFWQFCKHIQFFIADCANLGNHRDSYLC